MYVSGPNIDNNHLIAWAASEARFLGYKGFIYTLQAVIQNGAFFQIVRNIDDDYFGTINSQEDGLQEIFRVIQTFLIKQCGKRIKIGLKNKLLAECSIQYLFKTIIYCCLHSKKKDQYISRILSEDQETQASLMSTIQQINHYLLNVINQNDVLLRVQELQLEAEALKNQLGFSSNRQETSKKVIEQLEEELKKTSAQLKAIKNEKQKVIQTLQLSNFDEYLTTFQRVQQENRILTRYVQQLQQSNNQYERSQREMRRDIENQSMVIVDLNDNITIWKQKFNTLKMQSSFRFSFDDTFDHSHRRSFGTQIVLGEKENTSTAKKNKGRVSQSIDFLEECSLQASKFSVREQGLLQQMRNLRKYNEDLVNKLDTVYKSMNNLTVQTSQLKEKNQILQKQNKFYKKQISSLRRLQEKMEQDLLCGRI